MIKTHRVSSFLLPLFSIPQGLLSGGRALSLSIFTGNMDNLIGDWTDLAAILDSLHKGKMLSLTTMKK